VQFTARAGPCGPKTAVKEEATQNNIAARIIYWHRIIPARVPIGTICFRYPLNICYVSVMYWSLETHSTILHLPSEYSTEHEFCTHWILLWRRDSSVGVETRAQLPRIRGSIHDSSKLASYPTSTGAVSRKVNRQGHEGDQCSQYSDWFRTGRPRGRSWSPSRVKNYFLSTSSRPAVGST
jgi:hypothetical protein